jgi:hypothetical protein
MNKVSEITWSDFDAEGRPCASYAVADDVKPSD